MIDKIKGKIRGVKPTDWLGGLALFSASIFFFYDLLDGRYLLTERDLGPYFIPPRFFWVESLKRWDFPLWNPYQFCGQPFFANPQNAILYPFNGLFLLLPFDIAFNGIIILHFFLGGWFTYLLLRDLKAGRAAALISGLIFMLGGYFLSVHSLLAILLSSVWTPLIMMFFRRALAGPGVKNEVLTGLFMTISFLGGGLEIVYGNFLVLLCMVIFSPPSREGTVSRWKQSVLGIRSLSVVTAAFILVSGVQFIPFLELFMHSIRGSGISYLEATIWSLAPRDFLCFFLPDVYGYFLDMKKYWVTQCWLKTLYTGGLPFVLSLIFFLSLPRRNSLSGAREGAAGWSKDWRLYLALMLLSLFLSLGKYNPFYFFFFQYMPFLNGIRYPVKFLYIFIIVLSITAGLGLQGLSQYSKENERRGLKHLLIVLSLLSGFLLLISVIGQKPIVEFLRSRGVDYPDFNALGVNLHHARRFFFYLALFCLLLRVGYEVKWKAWTKVALLLFLAADLFGNMGFYGKEKTPDYFKKTDILEMVSSDRGRFRMFTTEKTVSMDTQILIGSAVPLDHIKAKHFPSMNLLYRLHSPWGMDVIRIKRTEDVYRAFTRAPSISSTNLIDLYGVKYVVSVSPLEKDPRLKLVYARLEGLQGKRKNLLQEKTVKLYENRNPILRAWLVKDFRVMDPDAMLSVMTGKRFHPEREVLLEEEPSPAVTRAQGRPGEKGKVEFVSESNNRVRLVVNTPERSFLVLNDTYFPGWKAFVDKKRTKIYRADYAFRAILVEPGTHAVEFVYHPMSFKLGAGVTFLGIIGCVIVALGSRRKKKREKSGYAPEP